MKKTTTKTSDWKKTMTDSTADIFASVDKLLVVLQKNKKTINKEIKTFGAKGSGVNELFEALALGLDVRISEIWNVIDEE